MRVTNQNSGAAVIADVQGAPDVVSGTVGLAGSARKTKHTVLLVLPHGESVGLLICEGVLE